MVRSVLVCALLGASVSHAQSGDETKVLESFKRLVQQRREVYQKGRVYINPVEGSFVRLSFRLDPMSIKFDLQKTSSLVSPYVGEIEFILITDFSPRHNTADDASADKSVQIADTVRHKHTFAYQEGQGAPTVRKHQSIGWSTPEPWYDCDEIIKRKKSGRKDFQGCLEEYDDKPDC
jgi:hypothetical protein